MGKVLADHKWMRRREDPPVEPCVEQNDEIMVVALTDNNEVLFIREPSIAFQSELLSLPTGSVCVGEKPAESANRELQTKLRYRARNLTYLGTLHPSIKYVPSQCHVYLARKLIYSPLKGQKLSPVTIETLPLDKADDLFKMGRLSDSTTIAALHLARKHLQAEVQLTLWDVIIVSR